MSHASALTILVVLHWTFKILFFIFLSTSSRLDTLLQLRPHCIDALVNKSLKLPFWNSLIPLFDAELVGNYNFEILVCNTAPLLAISHLHLISPL